MLHPRQRQVVSDEVDSKGYQTARLPQRSLVARTFLCGKKLPPPESMTDLKMIANSGGGSGVRGYTQRCPDHLNHLIHIPLNLIIREPDHPVPKPLKRPLPLPVLRFPAHVHTPIHLSDQSPTPTERPSLFRRSRNGVEERVFICTQIL